MTRGFLQIVLSLFGGVIGWIIGAFVPMTNQVFSNIPAFVVIFALLGFLVATVGYRLLFPK
jgi:hypothetical protein